MCLCLYLGEEVAGAVGGGVDAEGVEGFEVGDEVGDVLGDVCVGAEGEFDVFFEADVEEFELEGVFVVVDLGGDSGLLEHFCDGAVEVARDGAFAPWEVAEGVCEDFDGHGHEALDIAHPEGFGFGLGGGIGNAFDFVDGSDEVIPALYVLRRQAEVAAAVQVDFEPEAYFVSEEGA